MVKYLVVSEDVRTLCQSTIEIYHELSFQKRQKKKQEMHFSWKMLENRGRKATNFGNKKR